MRGVSRTGGVFLPLTVPAARYSEEFKSQVVREVVEKERTIASLAPHTTLLTRR